MKNALLIATSTLSVLAVGCGDDDSADTTADAAATAADASAPDAAPPPFGGAEDVMHANELLTAAGDYASSWGNFTGFGGFQDSNAPHGPTVRIFINDVAEADQANLPNGSILIKENFDAADVDTLTSITVMERRDGYNADAGDWFWAKFKPDGTLDTTPDGATQLAGPIGRCIECHKTATGDDYVFVN